MTDIVDSTNTRLEIDITTANRHLTLAENRRQFNEVLSMLEKLFDHAPSNPRIQELMERLADKSPDHIERIREIYKRHNLGFRELAPDVAEEMRRLDYDEDDSNLLRRANELRAQGVRDAEVEKRAKKAEQRQAQKAEGELVSVGGLPREVVRLKNQAQSTLNRAQYQECIDLCAEAEGILEQYGIPVPADLDKIAETARYKLDRDDRLAYAVEQAEKGNWQEALRSAKESFNSLAKDDLFKDFIERLNTALEREARVQRDIQALDIQPENVPKLLDLEQELSGLESEFGMAALPTTRQLEVGKLIKKRKSEMLKRFEDEGQEKLELGKSARLDEKGELFKKAVDNFQLVLQLDPERANVPAKKLEAERRRRQIQTARTTRQLGCILAGLLIVTVLLAGGYLGVTSSNSAEQTRQSNASDTAVAVQQTLGKAANDNTSTNVALVSNANSTSIAVQQTLGAVANANTATNVALLNTVSANTAIAITYTAQAQQNATLASQNATQTARFEQQMGWTQTAIVNQTQTALAPTPTPLYTCLGTSRRDDFSIRVEPNQNSQRLGFMPFGSLVEIYAFTISKDDGLRWAKIIYRGKNNTSIQGWFLAQYLATQNCPEQ